MFLLSLINWCLEIYVWIVIIRAIISWFNPDFSHPIVQLLIRLTEPVLQPIRKGIRSLFPGNKLGIDISPLIVIFVIEIIRSQIYKIIAP